MATNPQAINARATVTKEAQDLDFSTDTAGEATVTVPELRYIEHPADVSVQAYGSGDSDSAAGFVARVTDVGTDADGVVQLTVRLYQSAGSAAPMADAGEADVDHLYIKAVGV